MKLQISLFISLILATTCARADISVFACEPEWASLAQALAQKHADVFQATTAFQDPHHIEARPTLIAKMRRADLVVCSGADEEVGWLPLLIRSSGNNKVVQGSDGYFEAAMQVERLDIPQKLDRSQGDVHAAGSPHVHLDPNRMLTIATKLVERLSRIDADNANDYQQNLANFTASIQQLLAKLQPAKDQLQGKIFIVHHNAWSYLFDWLGVTMLTTIEATPGMPPSSSDLKRLLESVKGQKVNGILLAAYQNDSAATWLSKQTNIPVIKLPYTVGGSDAAKDLPSLYEDTVNQLIHVQ